VELTGGDRRAKGEAAVTSAEIVQACREADVRLVRFLFCDNGGLIRGKNTAMPGLPGRLSDGIGLTVAMMAMNSLDQLVAIPGMGPVGEIRLVPDPDSFALLPHAPHTAALSCDMITGDRTPWAACPRSFLKRMRARAAGKGLHLQAAFEAEFIVAHQLPDGRYVQADQAVCFSTVAMDQAGPFVQELVASLEGQGLTVEQYYPEAAKGQHEISIHHAEALRAADNHVKLRETIRAVAWKHGYYASLAPKPFPEDVGNGGHLHFSLWDDQGRSVFHDPAAPDSFSSAGRQFLAGVLQHLPALTAITCPSVNSYRRLQPHYWSSAYMVYGHDNREAALRIASPFWSDVAGTVNLELKACDLSSNPYLVLGAVLAAGLDGIERGLDPGEPVEVDPATLSDDERTRLGIRRLPTTLDEAADALERDPVLTEALGPVLAQSYVTVRRSEADAYRDQGPDFEVTGHFYKY
jgi:glutamine synthetase